MSGCGIQECKGHLRYPRGWLAYDLIQAFDKILSPNGAKVWSKTAEPILPLFCVVGKILIVHNLEEPRLRTTKLIPHFVGITCE